jgi:hypothetical protein
MVSASAIAASAAQPPRCANGPTASSRTGVGARPCSNSFNAGDAVPFDGSKETASGHPSALCIQSKILLISLGKKA